MHEKFVIIGAGTVGKALAGLLSEAGYTCIGAASRSLDSARAARERAGGGRATTEPVQITPQADLVLLTTPDGAIGPVCTRLSRQNALHTGAVVAHFSGALPSTILADARACGAHVGSLHPLQTFATVEQAEGLLPGSYCCIEGDPLALEKLEEMAEALGMHPLEILPEAKTLYHAAAVTASNYLVSLVEASLKLAEAAEIEREDALKALLPLIEGTVGNLREVGMPHCLTGPIARGDADTVRRHLEEIDERATDLLPLYRALGREAVEVALAKGSITGDQGLELLELLGEPPEQERPGVE